MHALADNLANFLRTLAQPDGVKWWSLVSLRDLVVRIGAGIVRLGRSVTFQVAEITVPRTLVQDIRRGIATPWPQPPARC